MPLLLLLCTLLSFPALAEEETTYFLHRDVYADFEHYLGDTGASRTYRGRDGAGNPCSFTLEKDADRFAFKAIGLEFVVPRKLNLDILGGFQGDHLWASTFVDDASPFHHHHPHGQFGVETRIELDRDASGRLTRFLFSKIRRADLNHRVLGLLECMSLR